MSVFQVYQQDGAKRMRPIRSRAEYMALRDSPQQQALMTAVRSGAECKKRELVQMNYSCLPNADGTLRGATRITTTVGMDIDHLAPGEMAAVRQRILDRKDQLGLLMLEESARGAGYHLAFARRPELTQEANLKWASQLLEVAFDTGAKDITRVFFTTAGAQLIYLDDRLFEIAECVAPEQPSPAAPAPASPATSQQTAASAAPGEPGAPAAFPTAYHGIPFDRIIAKYWELNNHGFEPTQGDRDTLTYQLACDLRHICDKSFDWLDQVIPCYAHFPLAEKRTKIRNALASEYNGFPSRLRTVLNSLQLPPEAATAPDPAEPDTPEPDILSVVKKLPQGVRESIDAVGPQLAMPVVTAICPCIGMLATGVKLDVHGTARGLNLIAYIAGDFASGKGGIDPVIGAWMSEVKEVDDMYLMQEEAWRIKKRAAKNQKVQPEEPKLPVRWQTLNTTVANLAERLANTQGKHAFSFTPEADTVAQKWRNSMTDFSVMLRQSYDGSSYEREARSADAVNVHIEKLLWNVCMCGTPDALYRVVNNYTDGFQSRIALARTPDNTFAPLAEKPAVLTERHSERIRQIAHLLPLMAGEVVLPKLEARGRQWLERIRLETMKNDDRTRARQRFRVCVTAQRMTCCLMLCRVAETLIQKHGMAGAESLLKRQPALWCQLLQKVQASTLLDAFDVVADSLLDNALYFFRERIENAFSSRSYVAPQGGTRQKRGRNDSIFERLDHLFTFEQAMQQAVAVKGAGVNGNTVRQMLKNWRYQELVKMEPDGKYRKLAGG